MLGDAARSQSPVHEDARRLGDFWKSQWDLRGESLSVMDRLASDGRPRQREVVIWLQPDKSRSERPAAEPLAYRLLDPAVFTEAVQTAVTSLPSGDIESQSVRWTAWRALLLDDRPLAESVFEKLNSSTSDVAEPLEVECLRLACAVRVGRSEIIESSWQRLHDAQLLPLWGLRALSLVAGRDPRGLELAQQSVRALIGEQHPFDSLLLFPQERDRWAKSDWLRDYYWEIGGLHGEFGAASHGGWLDFPVAKEFVRSERLLSELKSPLRLGSRSPMTALRSVTTALACARIGDFESWPQDVTADSLPLWREVSELAREVAGDLRTHSPGRVIDRDEETRVEPLEWLLLGTEVESGSSDAARISDERPTSLLGGWLWWPVMLLVVVALAGLWRWFRAGC